MSFPFFNVDAAASKLELGSVTTNLFIDSTNTIGTGGTDMAFHLTLTPKVRETSHLKVVQTLTSRLQMEHLTLYQLTQEQELLYFLVI